MYLSILFSAALRCIVAIHASPVKKTLISNSTGTNPRSDPEDPRELLYRELSPEAYFSLPFHDPGDSAQTFRRDYYSGTNLDESYYLNKEDYDYNNNNQPPAHFGPGNVVDTDFYSSAMKQKTLKTMNPEAITIFHLCYAMSYMWRRGRKGIHRYYSLRDTYFDHLPFEIGYITQTIMAKYQNVLELYEFATRMEPEGKIGRPHLFFMYKNILEDCRTIIHLCNMIHEVTRKYRSLYFRGKQWLPVNYNPAAKFMDPAGNDYNHDKIKADFTIEQDHRSTRQREFGVEGFEHDKIMHEDPAIFERIKSVGSLVQKRKEREYQVVKKQKDYYLDHGHFSSASPTTRRTKRWRSNEPMIYGWEPTEPN